MKKVLYVLSLCFVCSLGNAQTEVAALFNKYSDVDDVVHLKINGSIFNNEKSDEYKSDIQMIEVLVLPSDSEEGRKDLKNLGSAARSSNYETLMEVKSDGDKVKIFSIGTDTIYDSILLSVVGDELVLVKLDGKIFKEDIDKLDFDDTDGMNLLQQLKKR